MEAKQTEIKMNTKARKSPRHRAHTRNKKIVASSLMKIKNAADKVKDKDGWFRIADIFGIGQDSSLEQAVANLAVGRGTLDSNTDKTNITKGSRFLHGISRRFSQTFGAEWSYSEGEFRAEKRRRRPDQNNLVYRIIHIPTGVSYDEGSPLSIVTTTSFQKKLGADEKKEYKPKTAGKDTKDWLIAEITTAVDIYVDELMEENASLRKKLDSLKDLLNG